MDRTVRAETHRLLRKLGMTRIFGNPGSTELPMFRDFPDDFEYVLGLQESVVVAMADGYAQASRNAALVNLHSSAGTGHALGNLFTAYKNCTPLVVTAGQQARSILPFEPFLYAARPTEFPQPFVKWAIEPARAADVPRAIARAYQIAMTPPFGPAFVSIPVDDWDQPCDPLAIARLTSTNPGDPAAVQELATSLAQAKRPALVLAAGCARSSAWNAALALAEAQQLPVYVAPFASRNVFPENHALFQGFLPPSREGIVAALGAHDLVLCAGGPLNLYHTEGVGPHSPAETDVWLVHDDPGLLAFAPADRCILADSRMVLEKLGELAGTSGRPAPLARPPKPRPDGTFLNPTAIMDCIARLKPDGARIVEEAPSSRGAMQEWLPITEPDQFYTTASGGLGFGLPAAVGIALACPGAKVIALLGDGSAMYSMQGLFSAMQCGTPVSFLILNNGSYQALREFGRHFQIGKVEGTDLLGLDFCALAKGQGLESRRVETLAELEDALRWSFTSTRPTLVEIMSC